jgi:predicted transcriptional regulator
VVSTQIYLTEEEQRALQALARRTGRTESELIRDAVDALLSQSRGTDRRSLLRQARGLWEHRDDLPDFSALRREMDRASDAA